MAKKRSDGRYQISKTINGKRKYFYGTTKKEALEKAELYLKSSNIATYFDDALSFYDWTEHWLTIKKSSVSANTLSSYKTTIKNYLYPQLSHVKLVDISVPMIRNVLGGIGKSTRTIAYAHTILSAILQQAVDDDIIVKNVAKKIQKPKLKKVKTIVTLSKQEIKEFLSNITNHEQYTFFKLAFTSGLRRSELLGLRWDDIDFKKKTISINQTVLKIDSDVVISKTTKTASSRRTISIDDETLTELKKHEMNVNKRRISTYNWIHNNLVFPGKKGNPMYPTHASHLCKKYAKLIHRSDFTMHGTRHTHATLLIESGVNFKVIQLRLGHSSYVETMNTYSHLTPVMEADVVEKIRNIF